MRLRTDGRWLGRERLTTLREAGVRDLPILPAPRRRLIQHRLASPWTRPGDPVICATNGKPEDYRNIRGALSTIETQLGVEPASHDFRRSVASYPIIAARADEGAVTGVMGHANIATTRRLYAADLREAEQRTRSFCADSPTPGSVSDRAMLTRTLTTPPAVATVENERPALAGLL
jgi:integrase